MKKSIALIVAIIMLLTAFLCGCTKNTKEDMQDTTTTEFKEITKTETQGEFCRVLCLKDDGIVVWAGEYDYIYIRNIDDALDIKPLQTVVVDFSESDLKEWDGTFTDFSGAELCYLYILENPKSIRHTTSEEPTFG